MVTDSKEHGDSPPPVPSSEKGWARVGIPCDNEAELEEVCSEKQLPICSAADGQVAHTLHTVAPSNAMFTHPKAAEMIVASYRQKGNPVLR